jgi:membrane associated rhomboid family serine protease
MAVSGVNPYSPDISHLLRWGANFGPLTVNGQWYRLLTATFVHVGGLHLLFNMWVLWEVGRAVERLLGSIPFAVMYLVSGLVGSLVSLYWHPLLVSAGASGAIFGVCGALFGFLVRRRAAIPPEVFAKVRKSGVAFLLFNLAFGLLVPNIDLAAHAGGRAAGVLRGRARGGSPRRPAAVGRGARAVGVAAAGALVVGAGIYLLSGSVANVSVELQRFAEVQQKALAAYNEVEEKVRKGEMTESGLADVLEREVLPEWRAKRERLTRLRGVPAERKQLMAALVEYMALRQESWELQVEAIRERDPKKMALAFRKRTEADRLVQKINAAARDEP